MQEPGSGFRSVAITPGADLLIARAGGNVQVKSGAGNTVYLSAPAGNLSSLLVDGRDGVGGNVALNLAAGAGLPVGLGVNYLGGSQEYDRLNIGTGNGNDLVQFSGNSGSAAGVNLFLPNVGFVGINTNAGNDTIRIAGVQNRDFAPSGGVGHDTYSLSATGVTNYFVGEQSGSDTLDFSAAPTGIDVDLLLANGQVHNLTPTAKIYLWGEIENVIGSSQADVILGNNLINSLDGRSGNDRITGRGGADLIAGGDGDDLIHGDGGNDLIFGGLGNDILLGDDGNDLLFGAEGRDFLIGGRDCDLLEGGSDDDILIGGTTAFDNQEAVLQAILAEWTSSRTLAQRSSNIQGTGSGPRNNAGFFLKTSGPGATVLDDQVKNLLLGGSGGNLLLMFRRDKDR